MTALPDPDTAPSSLPPEEKRELFRATLAAVSRSFYLTLRVLPAGVREPVALGYLLARLSDTVADSAATPAQERLALLKRMEEIIAKNGEAREFCSALKALLPAIPDEGEQRLLEQAAALFLLYRELDEADRRDVAWVLGIILTGQQLDLERFSNAGAEGRVIALANAQDLDDYTWRVAGCVGEFWTRICFRHLPDYAGKSLEEMIPLGIGLGKGLQLINILRDAPADLRAGRCYLPQEELGLPAEELLRRPDAARPVVEHWEKQCEAWLEQGRRYVVELRPWRLRLACFLPWAIAVRTLERMREEPPLESARRVKVTRGEVWRLMGRGVLVAFLPGLRL